MEYVPACSALGKSASFGTLSECHRSKNSEKRSTDVVVALLILAFLHLLAPTVVIRFDFVPKYHSQLAILHRSRYKHFALFF